MLLQLRPLFMGELSTLPVDAELDFSAETLGNARPFLTPVHVQGTVTASADVVVLRAEVSFIYHGQCDRCLRNYEKRRIAADSVPFAGKISTKGCAAANRIPVTLVLRC